MENQLIICQKCGTANPISNNFCARCAAPLRNMMPIASPPVRLQKRKKHTGAIITLIVVSSVLAFLIIVGVIVAVFASPTGKNTISNSQIQDIPAKIGTDVSNGKVSIKVNSVKEADILTDGYLTYKPSSGGKYIVINITTKNVGNELYSFLVNNFQIESNDNKQYSPDTIFTAGKDYLNSGSMNPGLSKTGYIAFEVPKNVKLSTLTLEFQEFFSFHKAHFSLT